MNRNPLCNHYLVFSNEHFFKKKSYAGSEKNESPITLISGGDEHCDWLISNLTADICQSLSCQPCKTREQAITYLKGSSITKLIKHAQHGLMGACGYDRLIGGDVEIFYWLTDEYRGQGYAKQAAKQLFSELTPSKSAIIAEVFVTNQNSIHLLKSLNFEAVQRGSVGGKPTLIYRKTQPSI